MQKKLEKLFVEQENGTEFFNMIYSCWGDSWRNHPGGFLGDSGGMPEGFLVIWVQ